MFDNAQGRTFVAGWTIASRHGRSRETGDPLGIRVWANQVSAQLVPGLSNRTSCLQGYGLLCQGLAIASDANLWTDAQSGGRMVSPTEAWLRFERLWVIAQTSYGSDVASWPGRNRARSLIRRERIGLEIPLLGLQLNAGSWGAYRRSAGLMGLIEASGGRGTSPDRVRLTPAGRRMAERWRQKNVRQYKLGARVAEYGMTGTVTLADVQALLGRDVPPFGELGAALTAAVSRQADIADALKQLRSVWEQDGSVQPTYLFRHRRLLAAEQAALARQAKAVIATHSLAERPYRQYLRFGSTKVAEGKGKPPTASDWRNPCWDLADVHSPEVRRLRELGSRNPGSWKGVHEWAEELAARRGTEATQPTQAPPSYANAQPPAMSLRAARALFSQGFLGEPLTEGSRIAGARKRAFSMDGDGSDES